MDWIRENKKLAALMGVFLVAALGLAAYLVMSLLGFGQSRARFDRANSSLAAIKSADLFPSQENLDKKKLAVEEYQKKVETLGKVLVNLQPVADPISETDFQSKLKARIAEVRSVAGNGTKLPGDFALGFPDYTASLPKSAAVARELSGYLDAAEAITRTLIEAGVESIDTFERSPLESEKPGTAEPPPGGQPTAATPPVRQVPGRQVPGSPPPVVETEPVRITQRQTITVTFKVDQGPLQVVLNHLASPSKMPYFTALRLLRVENEKAEGPLRSAIAMSLSKESPQDTPADSGDIIVAPGAAAQAAPTSIEPAKPLRRDAIDVLGQELLMVYMEIDLINFVIPDPAEAAGAE